MYFLPPFSLLTGSPSTNFAGVAAPEGVPGSLPAVDSSSGTSSCKQTFKTRWPGGLRESHSTRKPEITGNRLHKCGQKYWHIRLYFTKTRETLTLLAQATSREKLRGSPIRYDHLFQSRPAGPRTEEFPEHLPSSDTLWMANLALQ